MKESFAEKQRTSTKEEDRTNIILIAAGIAGIGLLFVLPVNWWVVIISFVVFGIVSVLIASQIGGNGDAMTIVFAVLMVLSLCGSLFLGYVTRSTDFSSSSSSKTNNAACSIPGFVNEYNKGTSGANRINCK